MKQIIRLTESEFKGMVESIARKVIERKLNEDVLGNDWRENEEDTEVFNNYQPFESQMDSDPTLTHTWDDVNHDWSGQGEENIDPTFYEEDPDQFKDDEVWSDHDPTDNELYNY